MTIGGKTGFIVDTRLDPSTTATCDGRREVLLFSERGDPEGWKWGAVAGEDRRWVILDLDAETTLLIDIATDSADFPALVEAAMPIVESFVIAE